MVSPLFTLSALSRTACSITHSVLYQANMGMAHVVARVWRVGYAFHNGEWADANGAFRGAIETAALACTPRTPLRAGAAHRSLIAPAATSASCASRSAAHSAGSFSSCYQACMRGIKQWTWRINMDGVSDGARVRKVYQDIIAGGHGRMGVIIIAQTRIICGASSTAHRGIEAIGMRIIIRVMCIRRHRWR